MSFAISASQSFQGDFQLCLHQSLREVKLVENTGQCLNWVALLLNVTQSAWFVTPL